MAYIPDQPIFRRVEDIVQGDSQFHRAQIGGEMATGRATRSESGTHATHAPAGRRVLRQRPQVVGVVDLFQQRKSGSGRHRAKSVPPSGMSSG
jgi:hypothetical protein